MASDDRRPLRILQPPPLPRPPFPQPANGDGNDEGRIFPSPREVLPPPPPAPQDMLREIFPTPREIWLAMRPQFGRERPGETKPPLGFAKDLLVGMAEKVTK